MHSKADQSLTTLFVSPYDSRAEPSFFKDSALFLARLGFPMAFPVAFPVTHS